MGVETPNLVVADASVAGLHGRLDKETFLAQFSQRNDKNFALTNQYRLVGSRSNRISEFQQPGRYIIVYHSVMPTSIYCF